MKRDLTQLSSKTYDVLIVGGGIYGATAAWDATLRGLSVALVEKGDFGSATSSNSLKIVHGGLRYLQNADFKRMRESIRERRIMMQIAPHLVHPLPCVMPTYGYSIKSKEAMWIAMLLNDLISFDRNRLSDPQKHLPRGKIISKQECQQIIPGVEEKKLTGGAIWYDAQMYNSERLTLSFVLSAAEAGADVANYVKVTGFLMDDYRVMGVKAKDVLTGNGLEIRAKIVLNTGGPWAEQVLESLNSRRNHRVLWSSAMNLVTRQLIPKYALGLPGKPRLKAGKGITKKSSQLYFIAPWRNYSLIGTVHAPYYGSPDEYGVTEEQIQTFIDEINAAYPAANLKREDVYFFYGGLLPMAKVNKHTGEVKLLKHYRINDHKKQDGIEGLVSVIGVKYTTARDVSEKAINLVFKKLGKEPPQSMSAMTPVYGGDIEYFEEFLTQEIRRRANEFSPEIVQHLVYNYGSKYSEILKYLKNDRKWGDRVSDRYPVIKAEILYGIKEEMAQKLTDVLLRRTELGSAGNPGNECLKVCATIMAKELGWDAIRIQRELEEAKAVYFPKS